VKLALLQNTAATRESEGWLEKKVPKIVKSPAACSKKNQGGGGWALGQKRRKKKNIKEEREAIYSPKAVTGSMYSKTSATVGRENMFGKVIEWSGATQV